MLPRGSIEIIRPCENGTTWLKKSKTCRPAIVSLEPFPEVAASDSSRLIDFWTMIIACKQNPYDFDHPSATPKCGNHAGITSRKEGRFQIRQELDTLAGPRISSRDQRSRDQRTSSRQSHAARLHSASDFGWPPPTRIPTQIEHVDHTRRSGNFSTA